MPTFFRAPFFVAGLAFGCLSATAQKERPVSIWLTDPPQSVFFKQQPEGRLEKGAGSAAGPVISIDEKKDFQHIDGFGFALTGGSAQHIMAMSPAARNELLHQLITSDSDHIGTSYLRVSIGASDLSDHVFSYDDLPAGKTDTAMEHFDLGPDLKDVVPVLKQVVDLDPTIKVLGSSWSPPAWMKDNNDTRGGTLLRKYYPAFAKYLVKYILAMQEQGLRIDAITVQNEPLHPGNNPSMLFPAKDEAEFIKNHLGPALDQARLDTRIIIYDHNADRPDYPISILNDPDARKYIDGSAFHLYAGKIDSLSLVHDAYPDKNLYFTEQWVGAPGDFSKDIPEHVRKLIIGATRNWCKNVIEWNLAADSKYEPHTDRGGCDRCLGAVTIDGDKVVRNPAWYIIAHAAKFVRPGSVRIGSNSDDVLPNVAFRTPDHKIVLIVLNNSTAAQTFTVDLQKEKLHTSLNAGAVATYVIKEENR